MILQIVKLKTRLSEEELMRRAREREPRYKAIPGLLQKYYVKNDSGEFGGIYVWDSEASLEAFRKSYLATSIPKAYEVKGTPNIEILDILFPFRD